MEHHVVPLAAQEERSTGLSRESRFKTPTLRDVARRGPYMHDGSERTLADVGRVLRSGRREEPVALVGHKSPGLTAQEQVELVEFMKALTGEIAPDVGRLPVLPN